MKLIELVERLQRLIEEGHGDKEVYKAYSCFEPDNTPVNSVQVQGVYERPEEVILLDHIV